MAATLKVCTECGEQFHARIDAVYCSQRCKVKAWRRQPS
jgi:hypothetical protein